jgi:hypothetical protein
MTFMIETLGFLGLYSNVRMKYAIWYFGNCKGIVDGNAAHSCRCTVQFLSKSLIWVFL